MDFEEHRKHVIDEGFKAFNTIIEGQPNEIKKKIPLPNTKAARFRGGFLCCGFSFSCLCGCSLR